MRRILNQQIFDYPKGLIPAYYLRCLCCRRKESLKNISKSDYYLRKGVEKLNKDLDVVGILNMIQNVDIMHSILFDDFNQ